MPDYAVRVKNYNDLPAAATDNATVADESIAGPSNTSGLSQEMHEVNNVNLITQPIRANKDALNDEDINRGINDWLTQHRLEWKEFQRQGYNSPNLQREKLDELCKQFGEIITIEELHKPDVQLIRKAVTTLAETLNSVWNTSELTRERHELIQQCHPIRRCVSSFPTLEKIVRMLNTLFNALDVQLGLLLQPENDVASLDGIMTSSAKNQTAHHSHGTSSAVSVEPIQIFQDTEDAPVTQESIKLSDDKLLHIILSEEARASIDAALKNANQRVKKVREWTTSGPQVGKRWASLAEAVQITTAAMECVQKRSSQMTTRCVEPAKADSRHEVKQKSRQTDAANVQIVEKGKEIVNEIWGKANLTTRHSFLQAQKGASPLVNTVLYAMDDGHIRTWEKIVEGMRNIVHSAPFDMSREEEREFFVSLQESLKINYKLIKDFHTGITKIQQIPANVVIALRTLESAINEPFKRVPLEIRREHEEKIQEFFASLQESLKINYKSIKDFHTSITELQQIPANVGMALRRLESAINEPFKRVPLDIRREYEEKIQEFFASLQESLNSNYKSIKDLHTSITEKIQQIPSNVGMALRRLESAINEPFKRVPLEIRREYEEKIQEFFASLQESSKHLPTKITKEMQQIPTIFLKIESALNSPFKREPLEIRRTHAKRVNYFFSADIARREEEPSEVLFGPYLPLNVSLEGLTLTLLNNIDSLRGAAEDLTDANERSQDKDVKKFASDACKVAVSVMSKTTAKLFIEEIDRLKKMIRSGNSEKIHNPNKKIRHLDFLIDHYEKAADIAFDIWRMGIELQCSNNPPSVNSTRRSIFKLDYSLEKMKLDVKNRTCQITGKIVSLNSQDGRLAQGAAKEACQLISETAEYYPETDMTLFKETITRVVKEELKLLSKKDDGLMAQRFEHALQNVIAGRRPTYKTANKLLEQNSQSLGEYTRKWAREKLTSGLIVTTILYGDKTLEYIVSTLWRRKLLSPYIRYLKILLAPITVGIIIRKMKRSVRPGEERPDVIISTYIKNEIAKNAFRLVSFLLPSLVSNAAAGVIAGHGILTDSKYRQSFLPNAAKSLPLSIGMAGGCLGAQAAFKRACISMQSKEIRIPDKEYFVMNDEISSKTRLDTEEIRVPDGVKFIVKGDFGFRLEVRKHIEELRKHSSGRAVLERMAGQEIEINPPHDDDWLRTEQDGKSYFRSYVVGQRIIFDPYNTYYGVNRIDGKDIETWRNLDPSIVLFHELLHIYHGNSQHDTIIPSDPTRLDENDYRKEFYESRNLNVIERPHSENDKTDNQYASVSALGNLNNVETYEKKSGFDSTENHKQGIQVKTSQDIKEEKEYCNKEIISLRRELGGRKLSNHPTIGHLIDPIESSKHIIEQAEIARLQSCIEELEKRIQECDQLLVMIKKRALDWYLCREFGKSFEFSLPDIDTYHNNEWEYCIVKHNNNFILMPQSKAKKNPSIKILLNVKIMTMGKVRVVIADDEEVINKYDIMVDVWNMSDNQKGMSDDDIGAYAVLEEGYPEKFTLSESESIEINSSENIEKLISTIDTRLTNLNTDSLHVKNQLNMLKACLSEFKHGDVINKIKEYTPRNDFHDIIFSRGQARKISQQAGWVIESSGEELLAALIYHQVMNKKVRKLNVSDVLNYYHLETKRLNPLNNFISPSIIDDYISLEELKSSSSFELQADFNNQFYDYRDKHSDSDARISVLKIIAGSNLSDDEIIDKPMRVNTYTLLGRSRAALRVPDEKGGWKRDAYPDEKPYVYIPGRLTVIQLSSGRYVLYSNLLVINKAIVLSQEEGNNLFIPKPNRNWSAPDKSWGVPFMGGQDLPSGIRISNEPNNSANKVVECLFGGDWDSNPLKKISDNSFSFALDTTDNINPEDRTSVCNYLRNSVRIGLQDKAKALQSILREKSAPQTVAEFLVPFYSTLYNRKTDREFKADRFDVLLDLASLFPLGKGGAGSLKIAKRFNKVATHIVLKNRALGLSGRKLWQKSIYEIAPHARKALVQGCSIIASAIYDTIEPIPLRAAGRKIISLFNKGKHAKPINKFIPAGIRLSTKEIDSLTLMDNGTYKNSKGERGILDQDLFYPVKIDSSTGDIVINNGESSSVVVSQIGNRWGVVEHGKHEPRQKVSKKIVSGTDLSVATQQIRSVLDKGISYTENMHVKKSGFEYINNSGYTPKVKTYLVIKDGKVINSKSVIAINANDVPIIIDDSAMVSGALQTVDIVHSESTWERRFHDNIAKDGDFTVSIEDVNYNEYLRNKSTREINSSLNDALNNVERRDVNIVSTSPSGFSEIKSHPILNAKYNSLLDDDLDWNMIGNQSATLSNWLKDYKNVEVPKKWKKGGGKYGIYEGIDGALYLKTESGFVKFTPRESDFIEGKISYGGQEDLVAIYSKDRWFFCKESEVLTSPWDNFNEIMVPGMKLVDEVKIPEGMKDNNFDSILKNENALNSWRVENIEVQKQTDTNVNRGIARNIESELESVSECLEGELDVLEKKQNKNENDNREIEKLKKSFEHYVHNNSFADNYTRYDSYQEILNSRNQNAIDFANRVKEGFIKSNNNAAAILAMLKTTEGRDVVKKYLRDGLGGNLSDSQLNGIVDKIGYDSKVLYNKTKSDMLNNFNNIVFVIPKTDLARRTNTTLAFVNIGDDKFRTVVNKAAFDTPRKKFDEEKLVTDTIVHETSHFTSGTEDALYVQDISYKEPPSFQELRTYVEMKLDREFNKSAGSDSDDGIYDRESFLKVVFNIDDGAIPYNEIDDFFNSSKDFYEKNKDVVIAKVIINNADTLASIIDDIASGKPAISSRNKRDLSIQQGNNVDYSYAITQAIMKVNHPVTMK